MVKKYVLQIYDQTSLMNKINFIYTFYGRWIDRSSSKTRLISYNNRGKKKPLYESFLHQCGNEKL